MRVVNKSFEINASACNGMFKNAIVFSNLLPEKKMKKIEYNFLAVVPDAKIRNNVRMDNNCVQSTLYYSIVIS